MDGRVRTVTTFEPGDVCTFHASRGYECLHDLRRAQSCSITIDWGCIVTVLCSIEFEEGVRVSYILGTFGTAWTHDDYVRAVQASDER